MARLSSEEIILYIKNALAPLECVVESRNFGNEYGFAVYFDDRDRLLVEGWFRRDVQQQEILESRLLSVRSILAEQGETLNDWYGIPQRTNC